MPVGYRVAGWRIGEPIGAGAWGRVFAASGGGALPDAAAKFLHPGRLSPGQRRTMAQLADREMAFSRSADHPNLIRTLAVTTVEDPGRPGLDGAVVLVMERAERSLHDLLAGAQPRTPVAGAARILADVCAGLTHMHRTGWVHGDLKPANVLLMADGTAKLADFGLTAELDGTHAYAPPLGSPDHVPPEWWSQRSGPRGVALRPSADLWAFGVLAHQLLTGGLHPFLGATARARALAAQSYARGAAPLRLDDGLPEPWREVVAACLTVDRRERAAVDLAALLARTSVGAPGVRTASVARPRRRGVRAVLVPAAGLVLAVTGLAASAVLPGAAVLPAADRGRPPPPVAGAIPAGADVPAGLRGPIEDAARRCPEPEITPVVLAAMLKAESNFDPAAARPESNEYGIAMWTPTVFNAWALDADHDGRKDYLSPPDAIAAMGGYACWLAQRFKQRGLTGSLPGLVAAGYRTSDKTVAEAGGVPERVRPHVAKVLGYLAEYGG
ncbi:protein kinase domain-containing protein [Kitasatospora sp. NPDC054939]